MTRLCDLSNDGNTVTSVSWSERGHQLAVGTHHGYVTVWDVQASKQVSNFTMFLATSPRNKKCHEMVEIKAVQVHCSRSGEMLCKFAFMAFTVHRKRQRSDLKCCANQYLVFITKSVLTFHHFDIA